MNTSISRKIFFSKSLLVATEIVVTMKKIKFLCIALCISNFSFAQGGWIFDTNPLNAVTNYTTIYPYVGCSFIDINGDNLVDLYAAPKYLFINNGDGTFAQTTSLPFTEQSSISGSSSADLDNDGDNDIIVACVPSKVFFNNGNATFSDSTSQVPNFGLYGSWAVAIGDYNENRELDFIFAHANGFHPPSIPSPCKFYKQQTTIFDPLSVSLPPVTDSLFSYTNPYWSDYDLDGDMDLFMASGPVQFAAPDPCYKNMKIETGIDSLAPMSTELFATQAQDGQCYNFIDYDNDGDFDLCITSWQSAPTRFYRNDGEGNYVSVAIPFTTTTVNLANCWGDYDNDGDLDVIITNGDFPTKYYRNNGNATFTYLPGGLTTPTGTCGITNADYDNDGDLDIFTNGVGNSGNTSSVGLFINDTVAGNRNFVNIKLVGIASNRSAIGSIVKLHAIINGNSVWQLREVNAQNSFQGQNDLRVHFGLGDAAVIDSLIIKWPQGIEDTYTNVEVNKYYEAIEGSTISIVTNVKESANAELTDFTLFQNYPNPFNPSTKIAYSIKEPGLVELKMYDILGNEVDVLVNENQSVGSYEINFNAGNLPSGIYFYKLTSGSFNETKKLILLK